MLRALSVRFFALVNHTSELTYTPAWWVPGAHLQTIWGKLFRRIPSVSLRMERWTTPDDDEIEIHRLDSPSSAGAASPRLILLHGLEGSIRSSYLQGTLALAHTRGWAADVIIFRGCGGVMNRQRRMYHSGETSDLEFVVNRLVCEDGNRPLVLAGFSLGGNVLLKWLGERSALLPDQVRAAAAVSVPFDLERGSRHIESGVSRVYTRFFLRTLKRKARTKLERFPGAFDTGALDRAATLYDFDNAVTAPLHGFADAHDYYSHSSSLQYLATVRVPTLLLSARDDPFLPDDVLHRVLHEARDNALLEVELWPKGGHVGFVSGQSPFNTQYYAEKRVVEFLGAVLRG
jgi:predicted alpha/beta-fold hydrolase